MAKVTLTDITSGHGTANLYNANNALIETAFENTVSRDGGSPNQLESDLDLNGFSILNQANPLELTGGFNWEGEWLTNTPYSIGDAVEESASSYVCVIAHTAGTFATDLAAVKWQILAGAAGLPSQSGNNGKFLKTDGTNPSWDTPTVLADLTPQLGGDLDANGSNILMDNATGMNDSSDNEQIVFKEVASAVNHIEITNAATGDNPTLAPAGDDANIDFELKGKGAGVVKLGDAELVVPEADGTAGQVIKTDGAGTLSFTTRGIVAQVVNYKTGAVATGTTVIPSDDTIPQITEGDEYMSLTVTPKNASNKLKIDINIVLSHTSDNHLIAAMYQDTTSGALAVSSAEAGEVNQVLNITFSYYMTAGTTSSTTFKVRAGSGTAGTTTFNGSVGSRLYGGSLASSITITEYLV